MCPHPPCLPLQHLSPSLCSRSYLTGQAFAVYPRSLIVLLDVAQLFLPWGGLTSLACAFLRHVPLLLSHFICICVTEIDVTHVYIWHRRWWLCWHENFLLCVSLKNARAAGEGRLLTRIAGLWPTETLRPLGKLLRINLSLSSFRLMWWQLHISLGSVKLELSKV